MSLHHRLLRAALCASLSLPLLFSAGCSDGSTLTTPNATHLAQGNWQFSSTDTAAAKLPVLSGELTTAAGTINGILHTQSAAACVAPSASFELSGSADGNNLVTLTGKIAGGTLTLTGTLAADGKSLTGGSYNVVGGACGLTQKVRAVALVFSPMQGNYAGNFADADGQIAQVTANFSQSTTPDANGNFTLAGSATVASNPCFPSSLTVSNTQVTGNTFSYTLSPADPAASGNSVTASGIFSADGSTVTVTSWTSSGTCGADTGVQSTLTRQ